MLDIRATNCGADIILMPVWSSALREFYKRVIKGTKVANRLEESEMVNRHCKIAFLPFCLFGLLDLFPKKSQTFYSSIYNSSTWSFFTLGLRDQIRRVTIAKRV